MRFGFISQRANADDVIIHLSDATMNESRSLRKKNCSESEADKVRSVAERQFVAQKIVAGHGVNGRAATPALAAHFAGHRGLVRGNCQLNKPKNLS